jgi:superfamily II DNA/RNA helicase
MLDMGFIPDVERIVAMLPKIRQTLFFSATMAPEIRRLADAFLLNPKEISVAPQASTASTVEQFLVVCEEQDKREALRHLIRLEDVKTAFIFCNRKRDVDILYRSLEKHGFDVVQLHGDMAQSARTETLDRFRTGLVRLMVCSDVAARGIDITDMSHVFNFDVPHHSEDYVHRIGRTGRAGKEGRAFTIATPEDGKFVGAIFSLIGREIPRVAIEGLPELELDMEGRRRGRGRGASRKDEKGPPASRGRAERPQAERPSRSAVERPVAERHISERPQPHISERPQPHISERPQPHISERPQPPERSAPPREEQRRYPPDRDERRNSRRSRRDEFGIGEMDHADSVLGFGAHVPDFMLRPVILPPPSAKRGGPVEDVEDDFVDPPVADQVEVVAVEDDFSFTQALPHGDEPEEEEEGDVDLPFDEDA